SSLFRCNLDGTGCAHTDTSVGQGSKSGLSPSAVVDTVNNKLLVVTYNNANSGKSSLFRCNLNGTGCTHSDISAGQGPDSGASPSALVDTDNRKLLVVTRNAANSSKPELFSVCLERSSQHD